MTGWARAERPHANSSVWGITFLAVVAAAVLGAASETSLELPILGLLAAAVGILVINARYGPGPFVGVLILGGLNALPGLDLSRSVHNSINGQDLVVTALVALLAAENAKSGWSRLRTTPVGRLLSFWSGLFLCWYLATVLHTCTSTRVPLLHAITFSRQFLYMALVLPLLFGAFGSTKLRDRSAAVVVTGVAASCLAQIAAVAGHIPVSFLLHVDYTATTTGLTRIRGVASDIPFAALPLGYGVVLYGRTTRERLGGALLGLLGLAALALGLTRAIYLGAAAGLLVASCVALIGQDERARLGRRQLVRVSLVLVVAGWLLYTYVPRTITSSTLAGVEQRTSSLIQFLKTGTETQDQSLSVRSAEIQGMSYALRGKWLFGLGELDATYVSVPWVPNGDIENTDISLLSGVAMIGALGIAIYLLPLLGVTGMLIWLRFERRPSSPGDSLAFGGLAWCIAVIAVSPTLGLLFDPVQVIGSALVLALLADLIRSAQQHRAPSAARGRTLTTVSSDRGVTDQ